MNQSMYFHGSSTMEKYISYLLTFSMVYPQVCLFQIFLDSEMVSLQRLPLFCVSMVNKIGEGFYAKLDYPASRREYKYNNNNNVFL